MLPARQQKQLEFWKKHKESLKNRNAEWKRKSSSMSGESSHGDEKKNFALLHMTRLIKKEGPTSVKKAVSIIMDKACALFVEDVTTRATLDFAATKRKNAILKQSDLFEAIDSSDQFDFLVDIVAKQKELQQQQQQQSIPRQPSTAASASAASLSTAKNV